MSQIEIFPWDENFNTGIKVIDAQHARLVALLNELANHVTLQSGDAEVLKIFQALFEYTDYHFKSEEAIWQKLGEQDRLDAHRRTHQHFFEVVTQISGSGSQDADNQCAELLTFLTDWLASHILQTDRHEAYIVQGLEQGLDMEAAKAQAKDRMSGATAVLTRIILSLYSKFASNSINLLHEMAQGRKTRGELVATQTLLRSVIDSTDDLVWAVDTQQQSITIFNESFATYCRESLGKAITSGIRMRDLWHEGTQFRRWQEYLKRASRQGGFTDESDLLGKERIFQLTFNQLQSDNGLRGISIFARDITNQRAAQEAINRLAFFDTLTQLPNRRLLLDRLRQAMLQSERHKRFAAVLFVDLDRFKILNDTRGHEVGDMLLIEVAQRLQSTVREGDTVARHGGDEFIVLINGIGDHLELAARNAEVICQKILHALSQPFDLMGETHRISASIGARPFLGQDHSIDDLLRTADTAMYQAKSEGRNTMRFFEAEMHAIIEWRSKLESWMRDALTDQFRLYYQPQVDSFGRLVGAEALIRWEHPEQGLIPPNAFIPIAEETGLILPIGDWVIRKACEQLKLWEDKDELKDVRLAINVSARQFGQSNFVAQVSKFLEKTGANPKRLEIELTESMLVSDVNSVLAKMEALKSLGVTFALDDFGTGFSSMTLLKRLPFDRIKIDQAFVRDMLADDHDAAIVCVVISLGRSFGISVIAEGVETNAQRARLAEEGCDLFQGYYFGYPLPLQSFEQEIKKFASQDFQI